MGIIYTLYILVTRLYSLTTIFRVFCVIYIKYSIVSMECIQIFFKYPST